MNLENMFMIQFVLIVHNRKTYRNKDYTGVRGEEDCMVIGKGYIFSYYQGDKIILNLDCIHHCTAL